MSTCAAFGSNDSYFLNSPTKWSMAGLPPDVGALFTKEPKIKEVYEMALGPDGSYMVAYLDHTGCRLLRSDLPAGLEKWLVPIPGKGVVRDIPSLSLVLGPSNSYFAFDKNGSAWGNLPPVLNTAIEAGRDKKGNFKNGQGPQSVALGPDGSYIYVNTGGGGAWNLKGQNDVLNKFLHDSKSLHGVYNILSPCRAGIYMTVFLGGGCAGSVPTPCFNKYEQFAADWKQSQTRRPSAPRSQSSSASIGRSLVKGLGLVNTLLNAANGNYGGGNGGGGGSGGQTFVTNNNPGMDSSTFWSPIQSAASDPIQ